MVSLPLAWVPDRQLPGARPQRGPGSAFAHRTVFVNQFTSDCCLGLIMWLELTRKGISMTTVSRITFLSSKARRGADSERSLAKNMQRSPASGALAAVAQGKQGLEPRSVGLDEETFNLNFVTEEERLTFPTSMRLLTVKKLAGRKQRESIW